jgi:predicted nucleic-acid-binding Zn-ribbon protein
MENCSKCASAEIQKVDIGYYAPFRPGSASVPVKWLTQLYVCTDCGYTESYVKREDIPKVQELAETQARLAAAADALSIVR